MKPTLSKPRLVMRTMPVKKMRIEIFDEEGNRYTISFEGKVTKQKALRLLDIMELLGGVPENMEAEQQIFSSKFSKIKFAVEKNFPYSWFSSKELLLVYEQEFNKPISLSTVSTYLARLTDRGFLMKTGAVHDRKYRMIAGLAQKALKGIRDK